MHHTLYYGLRVNAFNRSVYHGMLYTSSADVSYTKGYKLFYLQSIDRRGQMGSNFNNTHL